MTKSVQTDLHNYGIKKRTALSVHAIEFEVSIYIQ